jgi:hypothetical protein
VSGQRGHFYTIHANGKQYGERLTENGARRFAEKIANWDGFDQIEVWEHTRFPLEKTQSAGSSGTETP